MLTEALKFCSRIRFYQREEAALRVRCKQCDCGCKSFWISLYICIISLPEKFRHIIVIVNQSLTSDQKMNWRHFVGVFFLVAATVLVLNIGLFIHLSMQKQVFIMCRSDKKLSPFAHHQSGQNQIGYPGEREITLPSCAKVSGPKSLPDSLRFVAFDKSNIICL